MDSSIQQINTLHPKLRDIALQAYTEAVKNTPVGVHPVITQGLRSFEESDKLYQQGRDAKGNIINRSKVVSFAKGGTSWHNYGLALDFALQIKGYSDLVWDETLPSWSTVVNIFKSHGFTWGGNFPKIPTDKRDYPHFEMKFGMEISELKAKHDSKDFILGTTYVNI